MLRRILQQSSPPPDTDLGAGIFVTVVVLAVAVILSTSFYLLLRFLRRYRRRSDSSSSIHQTPNTIRPVSPVEKKKNPVTESLPLFTFDSISARDGGDCAVCLSKFEPEDLLRLLPICCHAFHAECIDTWLAGNQSCPLCRSPIIVSDADLVRKFSLLRENTLSSDSESFRVEIGNVSRRSPPANSSEIGRSYSIGDSFDYVLDEDVSEVPIRSFQMPAEFKVERLDENDALAAEVGPRDGWLKEYLSYSSSSSSSSSSSRTSSFRSSGRWFFTGSGRTRTSELAQPELDMEASQLGYEISEMFRWLSGV